MLIRLRNKPKKPVKAASVAETFRIDEGDTIYSILAQLPDADLNKAYIDVDYDYEPYGNDRWAIISVVFNREESDEEFAERLDIYERGMSLYNAWYEENKDLIERELERRRIEKEKATQKEIEKVAAQKEKEILKLEKKLKSLRR